MGAVRCSSSLREIALVETLAVARSLARSLGITRVTEITHLDRVGLPVFVSIRPDAERGSVCVNAGKGLRPIEAEVGATMEAIELAWAEYRRCRANIEVRTVKVGDFDDARKFKIVDFGPVWGTPIDLDSDIAVVVAHDVVTGDPALVPAEAVIHPLPSTLIGARYFGTQSNGLASGNSLLEATVHAIAEVLERDVISFHALVDKPRRVANETLPAAIREIEQRLGARDFRLVVHWMRNPFGLPAFTAMIYDRHQPELTSPGDGLHPIREIALTRAVVETAQARLAFIHGGRDDLADVYRRYAHLTTAEKSASFDRQLAALGSTEPIDYADVPDRTNDCHDLQSVLGVLTKAIFDVVGAPILRVVYTPDDYPVKVVRVVVPGLELYTPETARVGPRLLAAIRR